MGGWGVGSLSLKKSGLRGILHEEGRSELFRGIQQKDERFYAQVKTREFHNRYKNIFFFTPKVVKCNRGPEVVGNFHP